MNEKKQSGEDTCLRHPKKGDAIKCGMGTTALVDKLYKLHHCRGDLNSERNN